VVDNSRIDLLIRQFDAGVVPEQNREENTLS
jgi:hypothetical protein